MLTLVLCVGTFVGSLTVPQEPLRVGVLAVDAPENADALFLRGVQRAVEAVNQKGGVDGAKVELVLAPAATPAAVAAAVAKFQADGVTGIVAPPTTWLADAARKAAAGKLPCVSFATNAPAVVPMFDRLIGQTFCMTRVGFVRDKHKDALELGKLLKSGFTAPAALAWEFDIAAGPKAWAKLVEKDRPQVLVCDAEPPVLAQFVTEVLPQDPITLVLTPRAFGDATRVLPRRLFFAQGVSPAVVATTSQFRSDYERDHGVPGFGVAEGYEGVQVLLRAVDAANAREAAAVTAALATQALEGVRGPYAFDKVMAAFAAPHGIWIQEVGARPMPYVPQAVPLLAVGASPGTAAPERKPQEQIGEPFGKWRTARFQPEEGAQYVLCSWADDAGFATAFEDLKLLGLATGTDPLVDHMVREEIMARVMAIASTKYGRLDDGTGVTGKSLRIAFGMHIGHKERDKRKLRLWPARFGGDHTGAGGEAFGTFCRVYTTFIRRTIFQANALKQPITSADREYVDGSYVFGTDFEKDKRSELIRALINSYAGSMALTLAHEVGHLAGLGHTTESPTEIMNVEAGAGLDYRDVGFGPASWESMRSRFGLVGDKPGKGK
jgi:hypothetical protein